MFVVNLLRMRIIVNARAFGGVAGKLKSRAADRPSVHGRQALRDIHRVLVPTSACLAA